MDIYKAFDHPRPLEMLDVSSGKLIYRCRTGLRSIDDHVAAYGHHHANSQLPIPNRLHSLPNRLYSLQSTISRGAMVVPVGRHMVADRPRTGSASMYELAR